MGSGSIRCSARCLTTYSSGGTLRCNLPSPCLMAISHTDAAFRKTSLPGSLIWSSAEATRRWVPSTNQLNVTVCSSSLISGSQIGLGMSFEVRPNVLRKRVEERIGHLSQALAKSTHSHAPRPPPPTASSTEAYHHGHFDRTLPPRPLRPNPTTTASSTEPYHHGLFNRTLPPRPLRPNPTTTASSTEPYHHGLFNRTLPPRPLRPNPTTTASSTEPYHHGLFDRTLPPRPLRPNPTTTASSPATASSTEPYHHGHFNRRLPTVISSEAERSREISLPSLKCKSCIRQNHPDKLMAPQLHRQTADLPHRSTLTRNCNTL